MSNTSATLGQNPLGRPLVWARDFAIVGAVSSFIAPWLVVQEAFGLTYLAASAAMGGVFGGVLGLALPRILTKLGKIPFWALLFTLGPALGLLWGAAVGASSGQLLSEDLWILSTMFAAPAAAAQLAWMWLPYTVLRAKGRRTWPLIGFACAMPVAGLVAMAMAGSLF